jgi:very-short-patch-repair endonuclease
MDERYRSIAALAATNHSVISIDQLRATGVSSSMAAKWQQRGLIERVGPRSFVIGGAERTWMTSLTAAFVDLRGEGLVAGHSGARLMGLDGFDGDQPELLVPRALRDRVCSGTVVSTRLPIPRSDIQTIAGLRVIRAERLIIDSPLFDFTQRETENAIDSAIRLRLLSEQRLRSRAIREHRRGVNGSRAVLDALVDSGGESRLERWFLRLMREARLPRPVTQKMHRRDGRSFARVDFQFPDGLVVEVAGHGTHATRRQRQRDAERHTELTLRGHRVLTFTYEDVRDRGWWVVQQLRRALRLAA